MPPWLCAGGDVTAGSRLGSGEEFPFILDFLLETLPPSLQGCQGRAEQPKTGTGQTVRDDGDGAQPQAHTGTAHTGPEKALLVQDPASNPSTTGLPGSA